jgi:hypothetical protein
MPSYDHTQRGKWHWIVIIAGWVMADVAVVLRVWPLLAPAAMMLLTAGAFAHLRVWDDGNAVRARLGPFPLFGIRVPYSAVESVEVTRTSWYHGWGLHAVPGAWLVINIWGFDAVALNLKHPRGLLRCRRYLIGTDEPEALAEFVAERLHHDDTTSTT